MNEFMIWVETNLTYENLVMMANVLSTIAIGSVLIWRTIKNTKETLLKNTDIVNNVNGSVGRVVKTQVTALSSDIQVLRQDNKRMMEALILSMAGDADSRLAAIKLLSESVDVDKAISTTAESAVEQEVAEEKFVEVTLQQAKQEVAEKIEILEDTL